VPYFHPRHADRMAITELYPETLDQLEWDAAYTRAAKVALNSTSILGVNHQIRSEAMVHFFQVNPIYVDSISELFWLNERISPKHLKQVRHMFLQFQNMEDTYGLRHLDGDELKKWLSDLDDTVASLTRHMRLRRLEVRFSRQGRTHDIFTPAGYMSLPEFSSLVKFASQAEELECRCVYSEVSACLKDEVRKVKEAKRRAEGAKRAMDSGEDGMEEFRKTAPTQ
jgi:hypothetical protein